ncbi:MAG TPA: anti-sigma factor [Solirubrobacteraceae bacterium]|nr:anti-sigma factor [Solirubrobacteraceae bacterium]
MSDRPEHREYADALAAYALDALPADEAKRLRAHLEGCAECRAELDGLRTAVDALPSSVEQVEPPPELKERLMAIVSSEAELLRAAGEGADDHAGQTTRPRKRRRLAGALWRPALAVGLAAVVAAVVIVLSTGGGTRTIPAQVSRSLAAAGVRAQVQVSGSRAELIVRGLPTPAPNHVDELWVKPAAGAPQPAGTFVVRSGSVEVSRPVRSGDLVMVTVEPGPGTSAPTTVPLLIAQV